MATAKGRLEAFLKTPKLALRTDSEPIIIPGSAFECISIPLPEEGDFRIDLDAVRSAKRLS
jgi:hypothetical protein